MKKRFSSLFSILILCLALILSSAPIAMATGETFATLSAGNYHTMAIKTDESLWAWGQNHYGQLGNGTDLHNFTPIKIMEEVVGVSAGYEYTMAIKTDGSLWAWGQNKHGQLGLNPGAGSEEYQTTPIKVMDGVVAVSAGYNHTMAIKKDGSLWAWGAYQTGPVRSRIYQIVSPVKVMDDVSSVSAGFYQSIAIKTDGSLWAWKSVSDLLGDGRSETSAVKMLDDVAAVSVGMHHAMAVKTDGSLWTWGSQLLGIDTGGDLYASHTTPMKVMDGVASASAGQYHVMAIKTDGSLWAWGYKQFGKLGNATDESIDYNSPDAYQATPVKVVDNVSAVSVGMYHTVAAKTDGSLWAWGWNWDGRLGDGTTIDRHTPFKIMDSIKLPTTAAPTTTPPVTTGSLVANPTAAIVLVDSRNVVLDAYNIEGSNYFKLRDIAMTLNGSTKQFEVGWDGAANVMILTSGNTYTAVGGELESGGSGVKQALPTTSKIHLDGQEVQLTAYNIGGNNFFKLRDLGVAFDFGVSWNGATSTITIDSTTGYKEQ